MQNPGAPAPLILAALAVATVLAGCTSPLPGTAGAAVTGVARVEPYVLEVDGQEAHGFLGVPASAPTTLLVFTHPWSAPAETFVGQLQAFADVGVLAVAMEFRGEGDDYKVRAGTQDTIAATLALQRAYPTVDRTLLYGWSMGGQVALLAVAEAPPGTFDYVYSGAGVADMAALWHSTMALRPFLEEEAGGTPMDRPTEYQVRSPTDRIAELRDKGVARYFIVHGAGDAPVPVEQAERLYHRMADAGLPVSYYVVTTNQEPWLCTPVVLVCAQQPPKGIANHEAGGPRIMQPLLDHRILRLPDPAGGPVRGTYDGDTGQYDPSDVG